LNSWVSEFSGGQFKELNLQFIFGSIFAPFMWLIGIVKEDITLAGALLGEKMVLNEFVAFVDMNQLKNAGAFFNQKSIIMSTYLLCGFANLGSIGMQIGAISSLAPGAREWVTKYGFRSVIAGTLVSAMSASIVGMILN
jgi:CNT family concentrative nucleoside transporter